MKTIVFHPLPPTPGHPIRLRATWPSIHRIALAFLLAGTLSLRAQPAPTEEPSPDTNAEPQAPVEPRTRPGQEIPAPQTNQPPVRRSIPTPTPPAVRQQAPPTIPVPGQPATQPPAAQTLPTLPLPTPGQIPGAVVTNAPPSGVNAGAMEEVLDAGIIDFQSADVNSVLEVYAEFVNRTVIRPAQLPGAQIILKTQTALTRQEIIHALDSVLQMNGITMIPVDEKFVKAVPNAQVLQEAAEFYGNDPAGLPETGTYVTHVVQLKYAQPSEVQQILTQFSKVANGILPVDSSQILVLRDYAANIKRMVEMIEKVDVITPQEFKHKVIPIKYALAEDIANVIGSLSTGGPITVGSTGRSGLGGSNFGSPGTTAPGTLPGQTQQQQTPTGRFGQQAATGQSNFRSNLQRIIRSAAQSGEFQVLGETKIIADARMNALLVFANDQDMEMIEDIVSKLDVVQAQVLIEAIILDVALSDSFNMGVTMLNRHQSGNLSGTAISRSGPSLLQTVTNIAGAGGSGFSYFANWSDDLEVALNMLASDSKVNVLSRPRIQTSHAEPASLFIGQTRPYVTGAFDTGFGSRTQFQQTQIGIRLNVLPLINQDGLVVLEIQQQVQELGEEVPIDDNFSVPATIDRTAEAKVAVRDGDTIILGGFISTRKDNTRSGVPVLKDIPLLGALFRSTTKEDRRSELMVLIRPTVLPTPEVASLAVQDERSRLPGIRQAEAENRLEQQRRQRAADEAIHKMEMEELRRTLGIQE